MLTPTVTEVQRAGAFVPQRVTVSRPFTGAGADDVHASRGDGTRTRSARQRSRDLRRARAAKLAQRGA